MVTVSPTLIPGLLKVDLDLHQDSRGWFKENWQREKMTLAGLPFFAPVQSNVSYNENIGVTRGFHAEPWDKLVRVVSGRVFAAWVDLREGAGFGRSLSYEITPGVSFFVPRGVANGYQTLQQGTAYSYLVNDHWSLNAKYAALSVFDPSLDVNWPIALKKAILSEKDMNNPLLIDVEKFPARKTLVIGNGQVGKALKALMPDAHATSRQTLDLADSEAIGQFDFSPYDIVINTAAYTAVDAAESNIGLAWSVNARAVADLAVAAAKVGAKFVQLSSDYVFDGNIEVHLESEPCAPLGVYGQSKAAGDIAASSNPRNLIVRTSWVIGDGHNFVSTMKRLDAQGIAPAVVSDQFGRPTFSEDLAKAIKHLLDVNASGTYNVTNDGPVTSWYEIARRVLKGVNPSSVSTSDYLKPHHSPRPKFSTLNLDKLKASGFEMPDWRTKI